MDPVAFLADLERKPETLAQLADALAEARPFAHVLDAIDEILLVGMGSSAYAAGVAAARLRYRGLRATAELASSALLDGKDGVYVAAPARRLASAQQSALMLREGPRRPSTACETGDWNHVDVYLTKTPDYRLLMLPGSGSDAELLAQHWWAS